YSYYSNSNKLKAVTDAVTAENKLGDFFDKHNGSTDYTYDANGNMVKDLNKDIQTYSGGEGIVYNHLNLPQVITVKKDGSSNKGTITYTYDATGNKLKKVTAETGGPTTTTLYIAGFEYRNDSLQQLVHE